jgi:hypothetical protein
MDLHLVTYSRYCTWSHATNQLADSAVMNAGQPEELLRIAMRDTDPVLCAATYASKVSATES